MFKQPEPLLTLPDLEAKRRALVEGPGVHRDWVYAPMQRVYDFSGTTSELPFPSRIFGLVKTHAIAIEGSDDRHHLDFLVWCLSFFLGMRLTTTEAGFVDATPLTPHALTDFILSPSPIEDALALSEEYWVKSDAHGRTLLIAVIHALFLAQNPRLLQYEEFIHLYAAIDAAYALMKHRSLARKCWHFERVGVMCEAFHMPIPTWACIQAGNSEIADLRNPTFHEALFSGAPLGFAIYRGEGAQPGLDINVLLEMEALICRFIVALLGRPESSYVSSVVTTRQTHGLDLRVE